MLRRIAPNLRAVGVDVQFGERGERMRPIEIEKVGAQPSGRSAQAPDDHDGHDGSIPADAEIF